jgi:hypothetical protein
VRDGEEETEGRDVRIAADVWKGLMAVMLTIPTVPEWAWLSLLVASAFGLVLILPELSSRLLRIARVALLALAFAVGFSMITGTLAANPYDWPCWLAFPWCLEFPW